MPVCGPLRVPFVSSPFCVPYPAPVLPPIPSCVPMRSPLLLCGFGCVCVLLLMAHATPALADAGVSPPSSVPSSRSAPARPTGAHRAHTVEFDADEIEGAAADDSDAGEVILENTDEQAGAAGASPKSTGDTDATSLLDVFKEPLASTIPARAFQADREAVPFDWLHLHYEARIATEHDTNNKGATQDDEEDSTRRVRGRLLDSTRKLGRSPLVFQLNSGQVHTAMEQALIGARIGERRTVTFPLDATSRGRLPALSVAEDDDEVTVVMEIVRFDEDIKEITLEDRSEEREKEEQRGSGAEGGGCRSEPCTLTATVSLDPDHAALLRVGSGICFRCSHSLHSWDSAS